MKKLLLFVLCLWSLAAYAQPGSIANTVYKSRVDGAASSRDTTSSVFLDAIAVAVADGWGYLYWNDQATNKHWDIYSSTGVQHVFDFNGGSSIDGKPAATTYSGSHTLSLSDINTFNGFGVMRFTNSSPANITVPLNATVNLPVKTQIAIDNQGSDTLTVVWTGGVTGNDGGYVEIFPGGFAVLYQPIINEWDLSGTQPGAGGSGDLTTTNFVFNEVPSGTVNGSNTTFTLANTPTAGTEQIFLDGVLQELTTDYTISSATITMIPAPATGSKIRVTYMK